MPDLTTEEQRIEGLYQRVRAILTQARHKAMQYVNEAMVNAYWEIGREIVEEEQKGQVRAEYGKRIVRNLSERMTTEFGKGFEVRNLWLMREFYTKYPIVYAVRTLLSWTHYRILMRIEKPEVRAFYEEECAKANWSTRELERQINSMLYERLALSTDKSALRQMDTEGRETFDPAALIKDPYVLEFTGLNPSASLQETDLETALMNHLQQFLLELGREFYFVARQQRISVGGDDFYVDLVFYHRILRFFLLIDLKTGKLTHQDIGQMLFYTGYYEAEITRADENPPVGLLLCADKNEAVVKYTLNKTQQQIFASRYELILPTEEELRTELQRETARLTQQLRLEMDSEDSSL